MSMARKARRWRAQSGRRVSTVALVVLTVIVGAGVAVAVTHGAKPAPGGHYRSIGRSSGPHPVQVAMIGDSFLGSGNKGDGLDGGIGVNIAENMGWSVAGLFGEGGTGFATAPAGGTIYQARVADVAATHPDLVLIEGGANDRAAGAQEVRAAARNLLASLKKRLPAARLVVLGPLITSDPVVASGDLDLRDALRDEAKKAGAYYVDPVGLDWFDGVDHATTGPGREYVGPDGLHLNTKGVHYTAKRAAKEMHALGVPEKVS